MVFAFLTQTLDKFDIISNQNVTPDDKAPIKVQLNKATDSGVVDVPKDLFKGILEASNDGQSRRAIMMHLFECFTQSTKAKHVRKPYLRVHAALILTEELILKGSPALVSEIASGYHFDLLQQLSFLEQFHWTADPRAQALVRSKAQSVRRTVAPKLEGAEVIQDKGDLSEDTASTCSGADEHAPITHDLLEAVQGEWRTKRGTEMKVNGSEVSGFINASLVVEGEFLYLHFPNDEKEYYAYLRADDGILCWSDGDFGGDHRTKASDVKKKKSSGMACFCHQKIHRTHQRRPQRRQLYMALRVLGTPVTQRQSQVPMKNRHKDRDVDSAG